MLCSLRNLTLSLGQRMLFNGAELTIDRGDHIGLIGLNGHGKSTLFNILMGKISPDHTNPPFIFDKNSDYFDIFLVPQELNTKDFNDLDIEHFYLSFYPKLLDVKRKLNIVEKKMETATDFDALLNEQEKLHHEFDKYQGWQIHNAYNNYIKSFALENNSTAVNDLSGGEKRKMALSIGLSAPHEFILWDEPTNHLDIETIEKFEDELMNTKKTFMIISHDRYLLNNTTNKILHIERGQINSFKGTYLDYLEFLNEKELELAKNLDKLENRHRRELAWMRQGIKARGTRSKKRVEGYHNIKSNIQELKNKARKNLEMALAHSGRQSKLLVEIIDGNFSYGDKVVFNNLNLSIYKKNKIGLIGPNGAGKTTLINIICENLKLTSGKHKNANELKIVIFDQNLANLNPNQTPLEAVGEGQSFITLGNGEQKHIHSYLEGFLFSKEQLNRPIYTLSGGEKKRLQLAKFMKQAADFWIFDEPTNDLDIETIEFLEHELKKYDAAVLIIGHDRAFLDNICEQMWLVHDKNVEIFPGGHTQVAPFLEALRAEKEMAQSAPLTKTENKTPAPKESSTKKVSMNYQEKKRWGQIENEIFEMETKISELEVELAQLNPAKPDVYKEKWEQKEKYSQILAALYEEWEVLSTKSAD